MTERSKRRAAEVAVIEAARRVIKAEYYTFSEFDGPFYDTLRDLGSSLLGLDALGLEDPGRARVNKGAPVTAQQAAIYMNGDKATSLCARIVRLLCQHQNLTVDEIERILNKPHQSVSPRLTELRDTGWVYDSGLTSMTRSRQPAIMWRLTSAARQAINGQEGLPI